MPLIMASNITRNVPHILIKLIYPLYEESIKNCKTSKDNARVARYISALIMKMRIFIIKSGFIVFQSNLHHDLHTFACAQTTYRSTYSTPIRTPPKHSF